MSSINSSINSSESAVSPNSSWDQILSIENLPNLLSRSGHPLCPELLLAAYITRNEPEKCLLYLLQYLQRRSSDVSTCVDLFSHSILSLIDQRVGDIWSSLSVPPHSLLHPLQCVECLKPLTSGSSGTDDLGVSMCSSCSLSEPLRSCSSLNKCLDILGDIYKTSQDGSSVTKFGYNSIGEPLPCVTLPIKLSLLDTPISLLPSVLEGEYKNLNLTKLFHLLVALSIRQDIKADVYDRALKLKTSALGKIVEFDYGVLKRRREWLSSSSLSSSTSSKIPTPRKAFVSMSDGGAKLSVLSSFSSSLSSSSSVETTNPFSTIEAVELARLARQVISSLKFKEEHAIEESNRRIRLCLYLKWALFQICGEIEGNLFPDINLITIIFDSLNKALNGANDILNEAKNASLWCESNNGGSIWTSIFLGGRSSSISDLVINVSKIEEELECPLCFSIMFEPVTTHSCGHSFCKSCLLRALDNKPECPMCRASLEDLLESHEYAINISLSRVLSLALPVQSAARAEQVRLEAVENDKNIAIFVCGICLPFQDSPLHIFEPRYRLMMRRAMLSGSRSFGMTAHTSDGCSDIGVTCVIRGMKMLPDGRSFIDCVGERRFKIIEKGMRDGYLTAKVEFLVDEDRDVVRMALFSREGEDESQTSVTDASIRATAMGISKFEFMLRSSLNKHQEGSAETFFKQSPHGLLSTLFSQLAYLWSLLNSYCQEILDISNDPDGRPPEDYNQSKRAILRRVVLSLNDADIQTALTPIAWDGSSSSLDAFEANDERLWRILSILPLSQTTHYLFLSECCFTSRLAFCVANFTRHTPHMTALSLVGQRIGLMLG